jgi:hypothetical protein
MKVGRIMEGEAEVGVVEEWAPGRRMSILWRPKTWEGGTAGRLAILLARTQSGTRITVESRKWRSIMGGDSQELLGWFAGEVAARSGRRWQTWSSS